MQKGLRDYTQQVIHEAWPLIQRGQVPSGGLEHMTRFQVVLTTFEPTTEGQKLLHGETLRAYFHDLVIGPSLPGGPGNQSRFVSAGLRSTDETVRLELKISGRADMRNSVAAYINQTSNSQSLESECAARRGRPDSIDHDGLFPMCAVCYVVRHEHRSMML